MPDPRPLTGLYGKIPAHGDFVRRGLPTSFVAPWDSWLAAGIATAREQLGAQWEGAWDSAPAWRFALPAGACGPDAVAGVMLPSQDQVGRRFPITLAALLAPGAPPPGTDWFDALEAAALAGLAGRADADALSVALPMPGAPILAAPFDLPPIMAAAPGQPDAVPSAAWQASDIAAPLTDPVEPPDDVLALLATPAAPWQSSDIAAPPPDPIDPPDDVLALLATPAAPVAAGRDDDALALLIGAAATPPDAIPAADPLGTLAGLIGTAAAAPPAHPMDLPSAPAALPPDDDGTLAGLIGAAEDSRPPGGFADASDALPGMDDGILAGLIGAGADAPLLAAEDTAPILALAGEDAAPGAAEGPDLLPETVTMGWPDLAEDAGAAPAFTPATEAPPAPEGGGWWTRGAAHVPPMVWPLPGLPAPTDFAYLLEAAA